MPRVKLFNEETVLVKAMELFWKKGYHATSIQDLVDHLQINRASLYDTYGGKKELFDKAFAHYRTTNSEYLKTFLDTQPNVKQGLLALFETAIEASVSDVECKGCFVINTAMEMIPEDALLHQAVKDNQAAFKDLWYNFLKQRNYSKTDKELKTMAGLIFTFYNGIKVVAKMHADKESLMASVQKFLTLFD
ncbi:TetR/AcrR family transcriptional regulator [Ascidiimonas aurantiaca]|uniref:TetR/AcrR family transcriptional regulator n=1 Tax=Ascidiimonas aurantiaca TaxID=1685432 RepID=UPI0030EC21BB